MYISTIWCSGTVGVYGKFLVVGSFWSRLLVDVYTLNLVDVYTYASPDIAIPGYASSLNLPRIKVFGSDIGISCYNRRSTRAHIGTYIWGFWGADRTFGLRRLYRDFLS